jgi:hypothetical protein
MLQVDRELRQPLHVLSLVKAFPLASIWPETS